MLPDLEGMALFVSIVEQGSISAAGRVLGMPKATVSRGLAALEDRLGLQLLNRSTRSLSLTDGGKAFYRRCSPLVKEAFAAEAEVLAATGTPAGRIRMTAAVGLGQIVLMPHLAAFLDHHPKVSLDLVFSDRHVELIEEGFDLAVRLGRLPDSTLIARRLRAYPRLLAASPAYLADAPALMEPDDLRRHNCILVTPDRETWTLIAGEREVAIRVPWRLAVENILAVRAAAVAGHGIAMLPGYVVDDDLAAGTLVTVLPSVTVPPVTANIIFPQQQPQALAVRRLIDFLIERLR
jgi:DNA-binding transcriptional LysR family regulator